MKNKMVSIIIRTKNEERWINYCLKSIFDQTYQNFEIIIVDNNSTDATLKKAKLFPVKKITTIKNYLPGKALNKGIKLAEGEYIVCLSAHCIPVNDQWLENFVDTFNVDNSVVGSYGRQQPMSFSTPSDKRDLLLVFGLDQKIQQKDSFFHNANSIIRKDILDKFPFDNETTNIEDRLWGQQMIDEGYKLLYTPDSSVYHHHGIHQDGDAARLKNVVRIVENMDKMSSPGVINPKNLNIFAIIPIKGLVPNIGKRTMLHHTIESIKNSKYINKIIVSTDNKENIKLSKSLGAECPFIRPKNLSKDWVNLEMVQKFTLGQLEEIGESPDLIVHLEITFPFRDEDLIDKMIENITLMGYDSLIASKEKSDFYGMSKMMGVTLELIVEMYQEL